MEHARETPDAAETKVTAQRSAEPYLVVVGCQDIVPPMFVSAKDATGRHVPVATFTTTLRVEIPMKF